MPDISMCQNSSCTKRIKCYRYMVYPNPWRQAYAEWNPEKDACFEPLNDWQAHIVKMVRDIDNGVK